MKRIFEKESKDSRVLESLLVYVVLGTIAGARLGHCLFYEPEIYLRDPIRILKIWEGGLASHGGTIGVFLALVLFNKKHPQISLSWLLDRISIPVALVAVFIRLGNFFNSEIIGKPSSLPWAVVFQKIDSIPRHPAQLYEAGIYLLSFAALQTLYRIEYFRVKKGFLFGIFLILIFGSRILIEFLKENQVEFERNLPLDMGQLLSIPVVLVGIFLVMYSTIFSKKNSNTKLSKEMCDTP